MSRQTYQISPPRRRGRHGIVQCIEAYKRCILLDHVGACVQEEPGGIGLLQCLEETLDAVVQRDVEAQEEFRDLWAGLSDDFPQLGRISAIDAQAAEKSRQLPIALVLAYSVAEPAYLSLCPKDCGLIQVGLSHAVPLRGCSKNALWLGERSARICLRCTPCSEGLIGYG